MQCQSVLALVTFALIRRRIDVKVAVFFCVKYFLGDILSVYTLLFRTLSGASDPMADSWLHIFLTVSW